MIVIVVIGSTFGGEQRIDLGVAAPTDSAVGARLLTAFDADDAFAVEQFDSADELRTEVQRRTLTAGLVVLDETEIELVVTPDQDVVTVSTAVSGVVQSLGAELTAAQLRRGHCRRRRRRGDRRRSRRWRLRRRRSW